MSKESQQSNHTIRVHIDRRPYVVPYPTTGRHLYEIASIVDERRELFKSVTGNSEDVPIPNTDDPLSLHEDDHFYSEEEFNIIVRAREKIVTTPTLTFEEVVRLAYDELPTGTDIVFTVSYRHGPRPNQKGLMTPGSVVQIKEGMVFDVSFTNRS